MTDAEAIAAIREGLDLESVTAERLVRCVLDRDGIVNRTHDALDAAGVVQAPLDQRVARVIGSLRNAHANVRDLQGELTAQAQRHR